MADDYSKRLSVGINNQNDLMDQYVFEFAERDGGIEANDWAQCLVTNSTYTACNVKEGTDEFAVTTYNPSTLDLDVQTLKVPPSDSYDVKVYDYDTKGWNSVNSTLLCYDFLENSAEGSSYQDCNLHVKT